jgi:hypothetical protein
MKLIDLNNNSNFYYDCILVEFNIPFISEHENIGYVYFVLDFLCTIYSHFLSIFKLGFVAFYLFLFISNLFIKI